MINFDDDGFNFTPLDHSVIEDLIIGQNMSAEDDSFVVIRQKNSYHIWCTKGKETGAFILSSLEKVFEFLNNN